MVKKNLSVTLDPEEQALEDSFEHRISLNEKDKAHEMALLKAAAKNSLKKDKRITIRVYSSDLENIKMLAVKEGLKYQSLITSILHKYATGHLKDS